MADPILVPQLSSGKPVDAELIPNTSYILRAKLALGPIRTDGGDVSATNPLPVAGPGPVGSPPAGGPLLIAGFDGVNIQYPLVTPDGVSHVAYNTLKGPTSLYRSGITAADKLLPPGVITLSGQAGGSLVPGTTYYVTVAANNQFGPTTIAPIVNTSPGGANGTLRAAFAAVTGALSYDVFLSTSSTGPLWVGRITAAQLASGIVISAVGVYSAGGVPGAVDIQVVGTGVAANAVPFTQNNAFVIPAQTINRQGFQTLYQMIRLTVTDLRIQPVLTTIFWGFDAVAGQWFNIVGDGASQQFLQSVAAPLQIMVQQAASGWSQLAITVASLAGTGASVDIWTALGR